MKKNFKSALEHVLVHEGGWADHPEDPGGATMKGVTLITFRRHFGEKKTFEMLIGNMVFHPFVNAFQ